MKGDFTRSTFQAKKHYSSVRMQQGRLQLDADWNKQADIQAHFLQTHSQDLIGICGAPKANSDANPSAPPDNFNIRPTADGKDLHIGAGRIYVDGILCELDDKETTYTKQGTYPNALQTDLSTGLKDGTYLAYLDVWQRHISAIEDPSIREVALNGADTATRTQTIAQVKLHLLDSSDPDGKDFIDKKKSRKAQLTAARVSANSILETHLYRVEIHQGGGKLGESTFKWSRDNGIVVSEIESIKDNIIAISPKSYEMWQSSQPDQWIEITDETRELTGQPGTLVRLEQLFDNKLICDKSRELDSLNQSLLKDITPQEARARKLKVRRWDYTSDTTDLTNSGGIPTSDQLIQLGNEGIQIKFESTSFYETGDYWLIPTRAIARDIEWTSPPSEPKPYDGIYHHYCRLAKLNYSNGIFEATDQTSDLRETFSPLIQRGEANNGNIGLKESQKLATLHVQGASAIAPPRGGLQPRANSSELDVSADPGLLNVGDTIHANNQTTVITGRSEVPGIFKIYPPLTITGADTPFSYQQPIVRFADSNGKTQLVTTAEGRVGIGKEGPTEALDVKGTIAADRIKLPSTGIFEAGILKAQELQFQKVQPDQSQVFYSSFKVATLEGRNQLQFSTNRDQNVSFAFHNGNVRLTNSDAAIPIELSIGNATLTNTENRLLIDSDVAIQKPGEASATLAVEGQVNADSLKVARNSELDTLTINQSLRFRDGQTIRQVSTDNTFQNSNHETLSSQLAIKDYIDRSLKPINDTLLTRAFVTGSSQVSFNAQNLVVVGTLTLAQGSRINEISTRSELRDTNLAVPTEQAVKTYVENRLQQVASSNPANFVAKTLTLTGVETTANALTSPLEQAVSLSVQGLPTRTGNVSDIHPRKIRSTSALQVGDTVAIADQTPRLITRAEGSTFTVTPSFDPIPTADTLEYQPAIAAFADSTGKNQLTLTANGLVIIGGFNDGNPPELDSSQPETKLYVNGRVIGKDIRGDIQQLSSREVKENITELSSQEANQLLEGLNPIKFVYTADQNKNIRIGFISEEVPESVSSEDQKAINPLDIIAVLTRAMRDQRQTTMALAQLVDRQQLQISTLQEQVKMLEQKANKKVWSL